MKSVISIKLRSSKIWQSAFWYMSTNVYEKPHGCTQKVKAAGLSETLVPTNQTTAPNPIQHNLNMHRCNNRR